MSYTVVPGSDPDVYFLTYSGDLQYEEMFIDDDLHLTSGCPIYIMMDTSRMNNVLPDHFFEGIIKSFIINPNLAFLAAYIPSPLLRVTAHMVVKTTQLHKRIAIFDSCEEARRALEKKLLERSASR